MIILLILGWLLCAALSVWLFWYQNGDVPWSYLVVSVIIAPISLLIALMFTGLNLLGKMDGVAIRGRRKP